MSDPFAPEPNPTEPPPPGGPPTEVPPGGPGSDGGDEIIPFEDPPSQPLNDPSDERPYDTPPKVL